MSVTDKSGSFLILFLLNFGWRLLVAPHFPFLFKTCSLTQIHVYTGCCSFNHLQPCLHFSGVHLGTRPESPPWSPQTVFLLFYTNVFFFFSTCVKQKKKIQDTHTHTHTAGTHVKFQTKRLSFQFFKQQNQSMF